MEKISVDLNGKSFKVQPLTSILDFINESEVEFKKPVAAVLNGHLCRVDKKIRVNSALDIIELESYMGQKIYESSLIFLFVSAFSQTFPEKKVFIQHSVPQGVYVEIEDGKISQDDLNRLNAKMRDMVARKIPIKQEKKDWDVFLCS